MFLCLISSTPPSMYKQTLQSRCQNRASPSSRCHADVSSWRVPGGREQPGERQWRDEIQGDEDPANLTRVLNIPMCRGRWSRLFFLQFTVWRKTNSPQWGRTFAAQFWLDNEAVWRMSSVEANDSEELHWFSRGGRGFRAQDSYGVLDQNLSLKVSVYQQSVE